MHRAGMSQAHSRSTSSSRGNPMEFSSTTDSTVVRTCLCGTEEVVRTSWTNANPGHRFRGCPGDSGTYSSVFRWIDPPMCCRAKEIIPGLLNRLNIQKKTLNEYRENVYLNEALERKMMSYRVIGIAGSVTILVLLILYVRSMMTYGKYWQTQLFYREHWTPEIEGSFMDSLLEHRRFNVTLSYSYCQQHLEKLKIRFRVFCWITSLAAVEWGPSLKVISADEYVWEQICKARKIDDILDDEECFFDADGTCPDDGWVHQNPPCIDNSSSYRSDSYMGSSNEDDHASWWAFVQEYYASNINPESVNMPTKKPALPPNNDQENDFVNAYRLEGEPAWTELRAIFGDDEEEEQVAMDYVAVSSDDGGSSNSEIDD
ncbi:hypothetical protein Sango_0012200 [Sesamum angolense]|uniref:Uncharacterized protein n=1 Tax=Sesamum angolense TaxID=2727404 RepID=A0AAE1XDE7_9LAMI|nr:hypothetical protein Sango_0012200 [Sesamum angolense]